MRISVINNPEQRPPLRGPGRQTGQDAAALLAPSPPRAWLCWSLCQHLPRSLRLSGPEGTIHALLPRFRASFILWSHSSARRRLPANEYCSPRPKAKARLGFGSGGWQKQSSWITSGEGPAEEPSSLIRGRFLIVAGSSSAQGTQWGPRAQGLGRLCHNTVLSVSPSPGQERFVRLNPWLGTGRRARAKKQTTGLALTPWRLLERLCV